MDYIIISSFGLILLLISYIPFRSLALSLLMERSFYYIMSGVLVLETLISTFFWELTSNTSFKYVYFLYPCKVTI